VLRWLGRQQKLTPYIDRLNPRYTASASTEQKRREAEAFEALNTFTRKHNGWVTSPPGKILRIEVMKDSAAKLTNKLTELGYHVAARGSTTRVTGAPQ
jgi:hypothetical protein